MQPPLFAFYCERLNETSNCFDVQRKNLDQPFFPIPNNVFTLKSKNMSYF